jgi:uncharacterized protein YuzE
MEDYPQVREKEGSLLVEFAPDAKRSAAQPLKMVLDFDELGEVVGIEIINMLLKTGKNSLNVINQSVWTDGDGRGYSYDEDSDSFYLRLKDGRSVEQKAVQGSMFLDDAGKILGLSAKWQ